MLFCIWTDTELERIHTTTPHTAVMLRYTTVARPLPPLLHCRYAAVLRYTAHTNPKTQVTSNYIRWELQIHHLHLANSLQMLETAP